MLYFLLLSSVPSTLLDGRTGTTYDRRGTMVGVEEVAVHLGVAKDSIYRWIENKGLPAHRIGRLWKFKLSEVDEWVRSRGRYDKEPEQDSERA